MSILYGGINVLLILSLDFYLGVFFSKNCIWDQVDLTRLCLRLCSAGIIHSKWSIMHRLRGARLVVHVATVAIGLALLATTSFLRVPGRPWVG